MLQESGVVDGGVPLAGASAGALVAAVLGAEMDIDYVYQECKDLMRECRTQGTFSQMRGRLEAVLEGTLPQDIHERLNQREAPVGLAVTPLPSTLANTLYQRAPWFLGGTQAAPYSTVGKKRQPFLRELRATITDVIGRGSKTAGEDMDDYFGMLPRSTTVTKFESRQDVIEVLLASCNVPFWFDKVPTVTCRGTPAMDGMFGTYRLFWCPDVKTAEIVVKIIPFYGTALLLEALRLGQCISPGMGRFFPANILGQLGRALWPSADAANDKMFRMGYEDAKTWFERAPFIPKRDSTFPGEV